MRAEKRTKWYLHREDRKIGLKNMRPEKNISPEQREG